MLPVNTLRLKALADQDLNLWILRLSLKILPITLSSSFFEQTIILFYFIPTTSILSTNLRTQILLTMR